MQIDLAAIGKDAGERGKTKPIGRELSPPRNRTSAICTCTECGYVVSVQELRVLRVFYVFIIC